MLVQVPAAEDRVGVDLVGKGKDALEDVTQRLTAVRPAEHM